MTRPLRCFFILCLAILFATSCGSSSDEPTDVGPDVPSDKGTDATIPPDGDLDIVDVPSIPEPFSNLPVDTEISFPGLTGPVHLIRDQLHMPHIYATNLHDALFTQGYVHSLDRFGQMELFRRATSGRLSELTGALDEGSIRDDIFNRTLGFRRIAEAQVEALEPDSKGRAILESYAAGVNQFITELRSEERTLPSLLGAFLPVEYIEDWEPADSLAIVRYQGFSLGFDGYREISLTADIEAIRSAFPADHEDPERALRSGIFGDLLRFAPTDHTIQFDVYPPVGAVAASDSNAMPFPQASTPSAPKTKRPSVPSYLLQRGETFFDRPHLWAERDEPAMSNNWVVSGDRTESGHAIVCNDPHLGLDNPPLFYFSHLVVQSDHEDPELFAVGASFPGVPGVLLGHNDKVAWATTTASYDYSDVFLENFTTGEGEEAPTVFHNGEEVEVTILTDSIKVGSFGNIIKEISFPIYITHRDAIMVTEITSDGVAPLESGPQLSFGWLGFSPTPEMKSILFNMSAKDVDDVLQALTYFHIGGANFVGADIYGEIFSSGASKIPVRSAGAMTFHPDTNPDGTAPWWILPGDGSADWEGFLPDDQVPFVRNPTKGFVVTANNDQVGQTLDNDPLNEPYYLGYDYDIGFRGGRITRLIDGTGPFSPAENGAKLSLDDMASIQADTLSGMGERINQLLVTEIEKFIEEIQSPGNYPELSQLATEHADASASVAQARSYLASWNYTTPPAIEGEPSEEELQHSVATTLFNVWLVKVLDKAFGDELAEMQRGLKDQFKSRALVLMMENVPGSLRTLDPETGESILWDRLDTPDEKETRSQIIVSAFLEALTAAEGLFDEDSTMDQWLWGSLHRLNLDSLIPIPGGLLDLPAKGTPHYGKGYPRPGDNYAVNVCNPGASDLNFKCGSGAIMRLCVEMNPEGVRSYNMLPGGLVYDKNSPHADDWLPGWLKHEPTYWPLTEIEVEASSAEHIRMAP